jgi:hypothetical protein
MFVVFTSLFSDDLTTFWRGESMPAEKRHLAEAISRLLDFSGLPWLPFVSVCF